ncbi:MAG: ExbD/TolR family protein, partial [Alphaproteobacteria bacterium]
REQPQGAPERRIFVRGDRAISYGRVMEVMGTIAGAGFTRVALLAEQPPGPQPGDA